MQRTERATVESLTYRVTLSAISIGVLVTLITLTLLPAQPSLALQEVGRRRIPGNQAVVKGWVHDGRGNPVRGAIVEIFHYKSGKIVLDGVDVTDKRGRFREALSVPNGWYRLHIHLGKGDLYKIKAERRIRLTKGTVLVHKARVTKKGLLTFLPFGY